MRQMLINYSLDKLPELKLIPHQLLGTKLTMSTADRPQTDGQSERSLRSVTAMLRHYTKALGQDWDKNLWAAQFAYNDSVHEATGFSLFHLPTRPGPIWQRATGSAANPKQKIGRRTPNFKITHSASSGCDLHLRKYSRRSKRKTH